MSQDLQKCLSSLCEISKAKLGSLLGSNDVQKNLILDPKIIKPLEKICGAKWLRQNGVDKIYKLEGNVTLPSNMHQYFIIYANDIVYQQSLDLIKAHINLDDKKNGSFHIIVIPKILIQFETLLESSGLYENVKLHSFQWFPISLDKSLLTLEIPNVYKSLFLYNDLSFLSIYAKSMWQLFFVLGKPKFTIAIGQFSKMVLEQLKLLSTELGSTDKESTVDGMLVFDRNMDYTSALLTPATYTALLNEVCDIYCGTYTVEEYTTDKYDQKFNMIPKLNSGTFNLDSNTDNIYNEIKHQHFSVVTQMLSQLTKKLKAKGETVTKEWNIQDGRNFISNELKYILSTKQKVNNHLQASETIVNTLGVRFERQKDIEKNIIENKDKSYNYKFLEEIVTTENNKKISLRLMCLMILTQKLSENDINNFCNKYFLEFGYNYGYLYNNLKRASFIDKSTKEFLANKLLNIPKLMSNNFYANATKMKQIPKDSSKIELKSPNCCSYVFSGLYVPFVASVASMLLNAVPLKELQAKLENLGNVFIDNSNNYHMQCKSLIIYVIGGVTYSEIAACTLLEKLTDTNIIIVSDKIISGNNIMDALLEQP